MEQRELFTTHSVHFEAYKDKVVVIKHNGLMRVERDDLMESVCTNVGSLLESSGKASCIECSRDTCIVNFTRQLTNKE